MRLTRQLFQAVVNPKMMIDRMKRFLPQSRFGQNALLVFSGSALAQAIPMAVSPILTRLYTPSDFGLLALYTAIASLLAGAATGRYETAVMLPKKEKDAMQLVAIAFLTGLLFCLLLLAVVILFKADISNLLSSPMLLNWLYLAPISVFLIGSYQTLNYWLIRKKEFKKSAYNKLTMTSFTVVPAIIFGLLQIHSGLLVAYIFGWFVGNIASLRQALKTGFIPRSVSAVGIKANALRYQEMPKYSALPALLDGASLALPILLVNTFFSSSAAGFFALTRQVILGPLSLIHSSVSQVLFQHVVDQKNQGLPLYNLIIGIMWRLVVAALLVALTVITIAPEFFVLLFGEKWRDAGEYARILACAYGIRFIVSPLSVVFLALERIKLASVWQIIYFLTLLPLFWLGHLPIEKFLLVYASLEVAVYLVYLTMILKIVHTYDQSLLKI